MLIAVVTSLFPIPDQPYRGWPIYKTVEALRGFADVHVVCPSAAYPGSPKRDLGRASARNHQVELPSTFFDYPAVPLLSRPWNGAVCARLLYPHLARLRPDLVLNYWLYPEGYASLKVARSLGIPVIVSSRGSDLRRIPDPFTRRRVTRTVREADHVLTVSEDLRQHAIRLGAAPERCTSILNGTEPKIFYWRDPREARRELSVDPDEQIILYVGRFSRAKGLIELVKAFARLADERPRLRLVCLGSGPLRDDMLACAAAGGVADRLLLPGDQNRLEVARWLNAADLLALPSYSEGCPNVVIEAISAGCPVVASEVGGVPELVNPECSILVPPQDVDALAGGLRAALSRTWDRPAISTGYARSWEDVARETFEVCRRTAGIPSGSKPPVFRSRPLRITVITPYFPTSAGSYRGHSTFHTLRYIREKADVEVICPLSTYPREWLPRKDERHAGYTNPEFRTTYIRYPAISGVTRPINGVVCAYRLLPTLRASRPDLVLNYWLYPEGFAAVLTGHLIGVPVIVGSIGSDLRRITDPVTPWYVRRTLENADGVITVSGDLRRLAIARGARQEKVTAILNGCDRSIFHPADRAAARRELGYSGGELILYTGTLLKTKGLAELLEAFAALAQSRPAARLALIGSGIYKETLEHIACRKGIRDRILMLGTVDSAAVSRWMQAADVFCLPSYSEGCPNVIIEALASGLPVVGTDVGGIPELVRDGSNGVLVPVRDVASLHQALDATLRRNWDSASIAGSFGRSWADVGEETYAFCLRVLESSRRASGEPWDLAAPRSAASK